MLFSPLTGYPVVLPPTSLPSDRSIFATQQVVNILIFWGCVITKRIIFNCCVYMDRFEADARGVYICFQSAGGIKLIKFCKAPLSMLHRKGAI